MVLIYKMIHKSILSQTVLNAYKSYILAEANTRYTILKKMAEQELKHSWYCLTIKTFIFLNKFDSSIGTYLGRRSRPHPYL